MSWRSLAGLVVSAACCLVTRGAHAEPSSLPTIPRDGYDVYASGDPARKPPVPASFLSHDGGWITFQYPPSARDRVGPLIAHADDLRAELAVTLGRPVLDGVEVRVARGPDELATLAPESAPPEAGASYACYPTAKLAVMSLGNPGAEPADLDESFRHELAHLALFEAASGDPAHWLAEGFAVELGHQEAWARGFTLWIAALRGRLLSLSDVDRSLTDPTAAGRLARAEAAAFVDFLTQDDVKWRFALLVEKMGHGEGFEQAVAASYGSSRSSLEARFLNEVGRRESLMTLACAVGIPGIIGLSAFALRSLRRRRRAPGSVAVPSGRAIAEPRAREAEDGGRVHIVLSRREERADTILLTEPEVPKVEHEGEWHTLH